MAYFVYQSTQINTVYPTNSDMKAAKESGYFKYDTNWYTERKCKTSLIYNSLFYISFASCQLILRT